jgi:hypothetical protein
MEIAELPQSQHPFYFGTQFHPEFKSRPNRPSPPFFALVAVASNRRQLLGSAGTQWRQYEVQTKEASRIASLQSPLGKRERSISELGSPYQEISRKYSDIERLFLYNSRTESENNFISVD